MKNSSSAALKAHPVVPHEQWLQARKALLEKEKAFTRLRDELSEQRRELPWEPVQREYVFEGADGQETLPQLFAGKSQLIVYHFMFAPQWQAGCKSCSFWADSFDGISVHLRRRDVSFLAISRAPLAKLETYRKRMGWSFKWVSSSGCDFNFDFNASFRPEDSAGGNAYWNYKMGSPGDTEVTGVSVFYKNAGDQVFHTYSCFQRGVDMLNAAYHYLDLTPKGRDEADQRPTMAWLRRHDEYET